MGKWPDKYVIGLTGNIGTGKTVVRRMVEHLGAGAIDADRLGHRVINPGGAGYIPLLKIFGKHILQPDGQVDRQKLGGLVFNNPEALRQLESLVHPLVSQYIDQLIMDMQARVIFVEAIKLFEAGLSSQCDSVWVVTAPLDQQLKRLAEQRGMSEEQARSRIEAQSPQQEKISRANVVIHNDGSLTDIWSLILTAWQGTIPAAFRETCQQQQAAAGTDDLSIVRATPADAAEIAGFLNLHSLPDAHINAEQVMEAFARHGFLLLRQGSSLAGLMRWQVDGQTALGFGMVVNENIPAREAILALTAKLDNILHCFSCESLLVGIPRRYQPDTLEMGRSGFKPYDSRNSRLEPWQSASLDKIQPGYIIYLKEAGNDIEEPKEF
jgi:dephospho-CoA kinase